MTGIHPNTHTHMPTVTQYLTVHIHYQTCQPDIEQPRVSGTISMVAQDLTITV